MNDSSETTLTREKQGDPHAIMRLAVEFSCQFIVFDTPHSTKSYLLRHKQIERTKFPEGAEAQGLALSERKRSRDWVKFKYTQTITCIATGYKPGKGQREHFGALSLALMEGDTLVDVGWVGSGFTEGQTHKLKESLDSSVSLMVEVVCLGITSGGKLRQPVFKYVRNRRSY